jgi:predicted transcriptional regulator
MSDGQTDLFRPRSPIAYQETSRAAYRAIKPVSGDLDKLIVAAIADAGKDGIICQDIETKINRSHQAVSGNLRHLVEDGVVEDSGKKGLTSSNRKAIKWILVAPAA